MAVLTKQPEVERGPAEKREAATAKWWNPRLLLAAAALCTGLSVALPAILFVFVYQLRSNAFYGEWMGDSPEPYVWVGALLSVVFGVAGIVLAILGARRWIKSVQAAEGAGGVNARTSQWMTAVASLTLILAMPALVFAPMIYTPASSVSWGPPMILLGLALIALAVLCIPASDPAITRRWLVPFTVGAFLIALLGDYLILGILFM